MCSEWKCIIHIANDGTRHMLVNWKTNFRPLFQTKKTTHNCAFISWASITAQRLSHSLENMILLCIQRCLPTKLWISLDCIEFQNILKKAFHECVFFNEFVVFLLFLFSFLSYFSTDRIRLREHQLRCASMQKAFICAGSIKIMNWIS